MILVDIFTIVSTTCGLFFFLSGSIGLIRFPDTFTRMHALTKADNLGLGLITLGLLPQMTSPFYMLQLIIIWILVMAASALSTFLVAHFSLSQVKEPPIIYRLPKGKKQNGY